MRSAGSCLGDVYERLVGDVAGRIEGWVGEEGTGEVVIGGGSMESGFGSGG